MMPDSGSVSRGLAKDENVDLTNHTIELVNRLDLDLFALRSFFRVRNIVVLITRALN